MKNNDPKAKRQIIEITKGLIREYGDASKITIRDICNRAEVGVGLVNYHFQTKENLINTCIQEIIGNIINGFDALEESLQLQPMEKLKYLIRLNMKFLIENAGLSKLSIMSDLVSGAVDDNSYQTRDAYLRLLKKLYGDRKTEYELKIMLYTVISALQVVFLRMETIQKADGIDLLEETQRNRFIDTIVERAFYDLEQ